MSWDDADDPFWFPHTVTVRDVSAGGGMGPRPSDSRSLSAEVKDEQKLVRNADGDEVVSSTQVTVPLEAAVRLGALVTVWAGSPGQREAVVLALGREENDPPLPSFLVLSLE